MLSRASDYEDNHLPYGTLANNYRRYLEWSSSLTTCWACMSGSGRLTPSKYNLEDDGPQRGMSMEKTFQPPPRLGGRQSNGTIDSRTHVRYGYPWPQDMDSTASVPTPGVHGLLCYGHVEHFGQPTACLQASRFYPILNRWLEIVLKLNRRKTRSATLQPSRVSCIVCGCSGD